MDRDQDLVDRVRAGLAHRSPVREVAMFGGLSFMVDGRMVVAARAGDELLVRVDPRRFDELTAGGDAHGAEMGTGRSMGKGWLAVSPAAVATDDRLAAWLAVALDFRDRP